MLNKLVHMNISHVRMPQISCCIALHCQRIIIVIITYVSCPLVFRNQLHCKLSPKIAINIAHNNKDS